MEGKGAGHWPGGRGDHQVLARPPPAAGPRMSLARPSADQLAHGWVASSAGTSVSWRQRRFSAQIFPVRTLREFKITRQ